jgi:N-acetylglucosaminyldiphosphoundecaprenol N-acetyl-beta-D-mannosaminyltransferase
LLGGTAEENLRARRAMTARYPGLKIIGQHGYFTDEEEPELIARILACKTNVLWVGLGIPREQEFAVRNARALSGLTWIKTCGGLFNFLSGSAPRAPQWMQKAGLEWLYRLAHDPRRLFTRYLVTNLHASWLLLKDYLSRQRRGAP